MFNAIAFNAAQYFEAIHAGRHFDICFTIEENKHRNAASTLQLLVKQIHICDD